MKLKKVTYLTLILGCCIAAIGQVDPNAASQTSAPNRITNPFDKTQTPARERITNTETEADRRNAAEKELSQQKRPDLTPLSEDPPTEFQRYVFATTGKALPLVGYELFRGVPSTFAPIDTMPVSSDYVMGPGDEFLIRAWGQIDIDYRAQVDRVGNIFIPKVGTITVAGIKYGELRAYLKAAIGRVFHDFELTVSMGQLRSIPIFVVGQARKPGSYTVSSLSTVVNAVFASGGPSNRGSMRRVQLKRGSKIITEIDLYDLLLNGDKSKDAALLPGDVIYIPPVGEVMALVGSVNSPGIYELKPGDTFGQMLTFAGGLTATAEGRKATIERIVDHSRRNVEEFPLDQGGLARKLENGDLITIRALTARYDEAVTLRGNVVAPGRYPWREGMTISDLIPDREALSTRSFWLERSNAGLDQFKLYPKNEFPTKVTPAENKNQNANAPVAGNPGPVAQADKNIIERVEPDINWDYASIQRFDRQTLTNRLLTFNLGNAIRRVPEDNLPLQPGDIVTIFSQTDIQVPQANRQRWVELGGEFVASGMYEVKPGETLRQLIKRVGGLTPRAYLYGAQFTRESSRQSQQEKLDEFIAKMEQNVEAGGSVSSKNVASPEEAAALKEKLASQRSFIEKLKQIKATGRIVLNLKPTASTVDDLPDIALEEGDRLVVPFRPETINVIGAVYNDNSYVFRANHTVGYYLRQAGGGTKEADKGKTFVVRADGSVASHGSLGSWFTGSEISGLKLSPGDSVIVPENLDRTGLFKGLKDWSLVIGQLALGAAAIRTLSN